MTDITSKIIKETVIKPIQKECIKCGKIPKDPDYINVNNYLRPHPTVYPICKTCETPNIPQKNF